MSRSHNRRKFFEAKREIESVLLANPQWTTSRVDADIRQLAQLYRTITQVQTDDFRIYVHVHEEREDEDLWFEFILEVRYQVKSGIFDGTNVGFEKDFVEELILNLGGKIRNKNDICAILRASSLKSKLDEIRTKGLQALEDYKTGAEFKTRLIQIRGQKVEELQRIMRTLDQLGWDEDDMLNAWRESQVQKVMDT